MVKHIQVFGQTAKNLQRHKFEQHSFCTCKHFCFWSAHDTILTSEVKLWYKLQACWTWIPESDKTWYLFSEVRGAQEMDQSNVQLWSFYQRNSSGCSYLGATIWGYIGSWNLSLTRSQCWKAHNIVNKSYWCMVLFKTRRNHHILYIV